MPEPGYGTGDSPWNGNPSSKSSRANLGQSEYCSSDLTIIVFGNKMAVMMIKLQRHFLVFVLTTWCVFGCRSASSGPSGAKGKGLAKKAQTSCKKDADCVVALGDGCCSGCGSFTGHEPPYRAVRKDYWEAYVKESRKDCDSSECPAVNCPNPPACKGVPTARCESGKCSILVVLKGECGKGSCPQKCGSQPLPGKGQDSICPFYHQSKWLHCCCKAMGGRDCEYHLKQACWYDKKCKLTAEKLKDRPGIQECPKEYLR